MPFLPFVVLIAWQAVSRSASFALGWATALYFGQVPGQQGHILAVVSLMAAGWVILVVGFALPFLAGAALDAVRLVDRNFSVEPLHVTGILAAIVGGPPAIAAATVWGRFHDDRSVGAWLRLIPMSYPSTAMLGVSVLQMVVFSPILLFQRWRQRKVYVQVPLVLRDRADDDALTEAIETALRAVGIDRVSTTEASGPKAWPLRTVAFAAEHLLGAVIRGEPMRLAADGLEIYAYATNISIQGPEDDAYRLRAAVERELAFCDAYLTWSRQAQAFEDRLIEAHAEANGDPDALRRRLDGIQEELDAASLNGEEWNVLYRRRLQVEQAAVRRPDEGSSGG